MKKKPKGPVIPRDRHETVRRKIIDALERQTLSARDISSAVRISEKEVYDHLVHIQKTISKKDCSLKITPAECRKCGFKFSKRERLKKPGRCPVCRGETIIDPLFSIQ